MCILFVAVNQHKDYPLIIAANRDEFFKRRTSQSHIWDSEHGIIAGKDLQAGGTWMGISKRGYIASLTNIRDPQKICTDASTYSLRDHRSVLGDMKNKGKHGTVCQWNDKMYHMLTQSMEIF